jgi:ZIP family zinc transporter
MHFSGHYDGIWLWLLAGMALVFAASTVGALPLMRKTRMSASTQSFLLGGSGGVMLGATFFSLILPALGLFEDKGHSPTLSAAYVGLFILLGGWVVYALHQIIPHEHLIKGVDIDLAKKYSRQLLVILAVGLHNLPEGLAVGVGIGSGEAQLAGPLSIAIALQDIPEGLIVAISLSLIGFSAGRILLITALTGLVESLGVLIGGVAIQLTQAIMPAAFALCAGAMLFVVSHEVIPESHSHHHERAATLGLMLGFVLMLLLDKGLAG